MAPRALAQSAAALPPGHSPPSNWLLPTQAARLLGVTKANVRYLTKVGTLHPRRDELGRSRFDPREVEAYARTRHDVLDGRRRAGLERRLGLVAARSEGQIAAAVTARLDAGETRQQIVVAEQLSYEVVDRITRQYRLTFEEAEQAEREAATERQWREEELARQREREARLRERGRNGSKPGR